MTLLINRLQKLLLSCLLIAPVAVIHAEEEDAPAEAETHYVELTPAFIVNLADESSPLHYLKTEVQLVVKGEDVADKIRFHSAPIRHNLVMLLSNKTKAQMLEQDIRETLQQEVLESINTQIGTMDKSVVIDEVLFTTFIVQ